ncbi:uncharacterized protein LOC116186312 [Apis dorsata]|uniref:uncharacterized protein LOC116186312 n=1 Tax=Apis dorsata TaxID=7462 RepID=UPI00129402DD|nr:uncharacterized protein LOC116186312 [Apis dorsata]XP_031368987.1 uncharacterized protein LOC116186312 [Apis dorsata]
MAQLKQQLPLQMPDLSSLRITTAVSMLGKAYGCGQCSAPPPGPTTSSSVGAAGATGSSVVASSSLGLVSTQQTHTPPQPPELPSKILKIILCLTTEKNFVDFNQYIKVDIKSMSKSIYFKLIYNIFTFN